MEELRTVIRVVCMGAEDCLVVDTFEFSLFDVRLCFARGVHGKKAAARCCTVLGRGVILWGQVRAIMRCLENCGFA